VRGVQLHRLKNNTMTPRLLSPSPVPPNSAAPPTFQHQDPAINLLVTTLLEMSDRSMHQNQIILLCGIHMNDTELVSYIIENSPPGLVGELIPDTTIALLEPFFTEG